MLNRNNGDGINEDCVDIRKDGWNDNVCDTFLWFLCDGYQFGGFAGTFYSYNGIERISGISKWGLDSNLNGIIIKVFEFDFIDNEIDYKYRKGHMGYGSIRHECERFSLAATEYINHIKTYVDRLTSDSWDYVCGIVFITNLNNTYSCVSDLSNCKIEESLKYSNSYLSGFMVVLV